MVHSYQIIFSIASIFAIVRLLYSIRTVWFGTEIIERKAVHTITYGLVIGLFLLVLKMSFCYDTHLVNPWNYAFGSIQSNLIAFCLSVIVCLNAYLSFVIVSQFFFSLLVAITLLVLEIWIFRLIYHLINEYFKEKNIYLRGYNAKLLREEISRLKGLGYNILPEIIGFGNYGTVYKCLRRIRVDGNENYEQMVAKVIDVSQLVKYRFGRLRHQEMANLQNSMNIGINALNALIHRNICQIERTDITRDENALISKVVLFSKMAQMNLDFYLEHIKPKGVGEECARFWFRQLCDAVNYLHNENDRNRCLTHSNIKPENVLLFKRVQRVQNCDIFQIN